MKLRKREIAGDLFKILFGVVLVSPLILAAFISFMPKADIMRIPFKIDLSNATLENYIYAFEYMNILTYLKNTFIMIIIELPCKLITALLAAYAFSYYKFKGRETLFSILLATMMIPSEVTIMSLFKMIMGWNLIDTYAGLTIVGLTDITAVFLFRQNMKAVPYELREASMLDGCGEMRYLFSILIPLCKPIIAAYALRAFIFIYNNYMWPLLVTTQDNMRTIQTGVAQLSWSSHSGLVLAAAMITSIIPLIVYFFGMDKIVEGMTAGAVKS
jgi:sn-glycerol 3-phosphate transport system permease protein